MDGPMTIAEFIEKLKVFDQSLLVKAYDPDAGDWIEVTGFEFGGGDLNLQTDDNS